MYKLKSQIIMPNDTRIPAIKRCFKEILGYTEEEIAQFISSNFLCTVAKHLTLEQISLIAKPFKDYDALIVFIVNEDTNRIVSYNEVGIHLTKESPKDHYYDQPVVSRDQLVDPFTQKEKERREILAQPDSAFYSNIPKCPTCQSTNIRKISGVERGASIFAFGLFSKKINKTFKCENCGMTW